MLNYFYITYLIVIIDNIITISDLINYVCLNYNDNKLDKFLNINKNKNINFSKVLFNSFKFSSLITVINIGLTINIINLNILVIDLIYKKIDLISTYCLNIKYIYIIYIFLFFSSVFVKKIKKNIKKIESDEKKTISIPKNVKYIHFDNYNSLFLEDMYKNVMILGSIGSGKTSTGISLFLLFFNRNNINGLILDAKGNMADKVKSKFSNVNVISFGGSVKYNPLDKPNMSEYELAGYIRNILEITSENNSDTFWFEKVQHTLQAIIIILRLNKLLVSFYTIHNLINSDREIEKLLNNLKTEFLEGKLDEVDKCKYEFALMYFRKEYGNLDNRVLSIIKSEITRITIPFISDINIKNIFCYESNIEISDRSVTVISFNIGNFKSIVKIITAFIKEDFQRYILSDFSREKPVFFICDEYQEFALKSDAEYLALSREAKCINILAMQSYTSLRNKLKDEYATNTIIQNCTNKIFYKQDDVHTAEEIVRFYGKKDIKKVAKTFTQSTDNSRYDYIKNKFINYKVGTSHSYCENEVREDILDVNTLTRKLKVFEALLIFETDNFDQPVIKNMKEVIELYEKDFNNTNDTSVNV